MTENETRATRAELFAEYFKLTDIVQRYDEYYLKIKAWGVTVSGVAAGVGLREESAVTFFIAALLALSFWMTEARFKMFQLSHMLRVGELERALERGDYDTACPRIFTAFAEASSIHIGTKRWRSVISWPQVMLPHVFFVALGLIGGFALLVGEIGRIL